MAIVTLQSPYDRFHGKVQGTAGSGGQVVFSTAKAGNVARNYVIPANPQSTRQTEIRGFQTVAAVGYKALTKAEADQWNAAAAQVNRTNILGLTYELSGIALYCQVNVYRQINALSILDVVPSIAPGIKPVALTSVTAAAGPSLDFVVDATGNPDSSIILVRVSNALPGEARNARENDCRLIDNVLEANYLPISSGSATGNIDADLFSLIQNDRVGVFLTPVTLGFIPGPTLLVGNEPIL